jgi:hypothetical protein
VPGGTEVLVIEGVGASRTDLTDLLGASVWVETSEPERRWRDEERMARGEVTQEVYDGWMAVENPFLAADRPLGPGDRDRGGEQPAGARSADRGRAGSPSVSGCRRRPGCRRRGPGSPF